MQMKEKDARAGKRPQWAKRLAAKPEILGLLPNTHMGKERKDFHKLPSGLHRHAAACIYLPPYLPPNLPTHTHTNKL